MKAPILFALLALSASLSAQTAGPSADQLKAWVSMREQRVDLLRDEIRQIDGRIESRLDVIIDRLTSIADSKDSRTKVARMKEDTMKALLKTIQYYDQKRAVFREELRNPRTAASAEEKRKVVAAFDARIQKRTQQILALNKSMPTHQDYERYKVVPGDRERDDASYRRNEDFEQSRRMTTHTNAQRDALLKQLDSSIARLDRMGRDLRTRLAATSEPAHQKELAAEVAKTEALIAERRRQRLEVSGASDKAQREIGQKEAMDLDQALKKATDDLRRDFTTLFQRYNSFVSELTTLHATRATLAEKQRGN